MAVTTLPVTVRFPAQVIFKCFFKYAGRFACVHHHVMFKPVPAYIIHQALEIVYLSNGPVAKSIQCVIGELAFTYIGFDDTLAIVGADAAVR